jgi:hypothetical protein
MFCFSYLAIVSTVDRESKAVTVESIDIESIVESVSTSVGVVSQETVNIVKITTADKINFFIL